jgi:hypothetical protein
MGIRQRPRLPCPVYIGSLSVMSQCPTPPTTKIALDILRVPETFGRNATAI